MNPIIRGKEGKIIADYFLFSTQLSARIYFILGKSAKENYILRLELTAKSELAGNQTLIEFSKTFEKRS